MGVMDNARDALGLGEEEGEQKTTGMTAKAKNQAKQAVSRAGDAADQKSGGKFADQVDRGQAKADEVIEKRSVR